MPGIGIAISPSFRLFGGSASAPSNHAPSISPQTFSIAENSANSTVIGTVVATDPDIGDTLTYSILSGNRDGAFAIDAASGVLTVADTTKMVLSDAIRAKLFIWEGALSGNNLLCTDATTLIAINGKDFSGNYIPFTSSATFNAPSSFIVCDTDYVWYNSSGVVRNTTVAELIGSDFVKTFVRYDSSSPYHIRAFAILKSGQTLSTDEVNLVKYYFGVAFMWGNTANAFSRVKGNRALVNKTWSPDPIYDTDAQALFTRMTTAGDTPTTARKAIINQVFVDLKANGLWTGFADFFYMFKAAAKSSANLNWLADAYNASDQGSITFTNDFGYTGTATSATKYIKTGYNASTNKVNVSQNNFAYSFWLYEDHYDAVNALCGTMATHWTGFLSYSGSSGATVNDDGEWYDATLSNRQGLITIERSNSNTIKIYRNGAWVETKTLASTGIANLEFYIMKMNGYQNATAAKMQFFAIHRAMSSGEHAIFYSIINAYMGAF